MPAVEETKEKIRKIIDTDSYKLIYIYTTEELKAQKILKDIASKKEVPFYTFDIVDGLQSENKDPRLGSLSQESRRDIHFVLRWIGKNVKGYVSFLNISPLLEADPRVTRRFRNFLNEIMTKHPPLKLFIISPLSRIPEEIQQDAFFIDMPLPDRKDIEGIFDEFIKSLGFPVSEDLKNQFINSLLGLREIDIENFIKYALYDGRLKEDDIDEIMKLKRQLIKKETLLEFVIPREDEDFGGMDVLEQWLTDKGTIMREMDKARDYGVDIPKGVLLFGVPGCGKSLVAKVLSRKWKLPLLRLDMGMILGPYVGQSEENIRKAIKIAESIAPAILWIDELEKGFAGVSGSEGGSSDVMKRVFGSFLTWMQEKTKPVFVYATANDISAMPPEFLRKGRFDEIFFVDLPNKTTIPKIMEIHLKKRGKEKWFDTLKHYSEKMNGYSGADIEAVVKELIEKVYLRKEGDSPDTLKKIMDELLKDFKPLSETMKPHIEAIRKKAKEINAKNVDKYEGGQYARNSR